MMTGAQKSFGEHTPRATGGYQTVECNQAEAKAVANKPNAPVGGGSAKRDKQQNHVGGEYSSQ